MKYLFQQMIAFWAIILTIMVVVGLSFSSLTKQTILNNHYDQMLSYAESIVKTSDLSPDKLLSNIYKLENFLNDQGVTIMVFQPDKKLVYPGDSAGYKISDDFLSEGDWKKLKSGKSLSGTKSQTFNNKEQEYAVIFYPLITSLADYPQYKEFIGVLAVSQPVSVVEENTDAITENLFRGFLISSLVALVFSYVLAQFQVNRINRMKKATKEISQGNFDVEIEIKGNDELDELAEDFNKMAQALKKSEEEIQRQEERRRQFMADAAHEMRTPLTTINGLLEGIAYKAIPKDQEEKSIELMRKETNRLIRLVNENLDYEKILNNQISMVIQKFNATEAARGLITQLTQKAEAAGNTLTLVSDGDVFVYADYDRFIQILFNITQNAIQFTTDGSITLTLEKGYKETIVTIEDTGMGMSEEELNNIWERYYKVDASRKNTAFGESGLGLSIVQQLVKLHHGEIKVESEKEVGTKFIIHFPDKEPKTNGKNQTKQSK